MPQAIEFQIDMPDDLARFKLPGGVEGRLQRLLDKQDDGHSLTAEEQREAEGLSDLVDLLALLRLRAERVGKPNSEG